MTTHTNKELIVKVRFLGPLISLDGKLSGKNRNLVFARNGAGKSFLSRGLMCLDRSSTGEDVSDAASNLVSDESQDGKASLTVSRGATVLGNLLLQRRDGNDVVAPKTSECIFHVFSEDFINSELRENEFSPDSNIEGQITVDRKNITLNDARNAVEVAEKAEAEEFASLNQEFDTSKDSQVLRKAEVSKQLGDYRSLNFEKVLTSWNDRPEPADRSFSEILRDLDSVKSIPAEPVYPQPVDSIHVNDIKFEAVRESLERVTSPSNVAEDIKQKIEENREFFETGTSLVMHNASTCPYCEQGIKQQPTVSTIQAYIAYFKDEEAKHKIELRSVRENLERKKMEVNRLPALIAKQKSKFDKLKCFVPSQNEKTLDDCEAEIKEMCDAIDILEEAIDEKIERVDQVVKLPFDNLDKFVEKLTTTVNGNNDKAELLRSKIEKSEDERRRLQRKACSTFEVEFVRTHWGSIKQINKFQEDVKVAKEALANEESAGNTEEVKGRVAETFELLVNHLFAEKYVFDRKMFVLKRDGNEMTRGPHRTLSDGEKTAIAFCYFIACIHRKVKNNNDYEKVFLVFDDPVTSMSYDFVFSIAETLKNLRISTKGSISVNSTSNSNLMRPELLILTHNSYFFNISVTNRIVDKKSAFALNLDGDHHELKELSGYIAPFQQQLLDIVAVEQSIKEPDYQTGNSVRSVLEAVGRFCQPDQSDILSKFITFLGEQDEFHIKSMIINNLSHGTYYLETPSPDELKMACGEVIRVVEKYAPGQLAVARQILGVK